MKKIFVYVGSHGGEFSNTITFTKLILNKVCDMAKGEIEYEIFSPKNVEINRCIGCINCFVKGKCPFDEKDDMKMLKEKMLKSDFVIFASPIYIVSVTGDTKTLFDRISYWAHLMRFSGKAGMAITTSCGNGADYTLDYLYKVMSFMGLKVVNKLNANIFNLAQINDRFMKKEVNNCVKLIYEYTIGIKKVESDEVLNRIFQATKQNTLSYEESPIYEYNYWKENGLFEMNNFQELIDKQNDIVNV